MLFLCITFIFLSSFCLFDYNGVVGSGQSLAVGVNSGDSYTTTSTQPFNNLKISLGSKESSWPLDPSDSEFSLVPLTEPLRTLGYRNHYPTNLFGETPHGAMGNQISSLSGNVVTIHTEVGESGQGIEMLNKGAKDNGDSGRAYNATLFEVQALVNLAKKNGKTFGVNGFILTHGEHDAGNTQYQSQVAQLYRDYVKDISAITGQSEKPVFLISQQHSNSGTIDVSTLAEWKVEQDEPGGIICSGPKYQYNYSDDGIHMVSAGYQALGEKYGEVYHEVIVKGNRDWRPLEPISAKRIDSNTVNVTFHVPNPPLVWDSSFPNPAAKSQWSRARGFELSSDNNNALEISSAEISGSSVLVISTQTLPSSNVKVGYAATSQTKRAGGTVRWGLLKDSDSTVGYSTKKPQPNWAIAFEMPVE